MIRKPKQQQATEDAESAKTTREEMKRAYAAVDRADTAKRVSRPTAAVEPPGNNWTAQVAGVRSVEVTLGEEIYCPVQYQSFRCGPVSARVELVAGQDATEAVDTVFHWLESLRARQFDEQLVKHLQRVMIASETAKTSRDLKTGS